jgi:hypothetical protein
MQRVVVPSIRRGARPRRRSTRVLAFLGPVVSLMLLVGCASSPSINTAQVTQQIDTTTRQAAASYSQQVATTYDAGTRDATAEVTVGWTDDIHPAYIAKEQERVKAICFAVQQALWAKALPLHQVTVTVMGPVTTSYTEQVIDAHGAARLTSATAAKLNWASLTPDTAWSQYDEVYLRSDYYPPVV